MPMSRLPSAGPGAEAVATIWRDRSAGSRLNRRRHNRRVPLLVEPAVPAGRMAGLTQPVIDADRLLLRPWRSSDLPALVAAYSDPAIQRWHCRSMTDGEAGSWIEAWPDRWRQETGAGWAVVDESEVIGQVSLRRLMLGDGLAEVSYWVLPAARGRRVASRALSAVTAWSFAVLGLHRVELNHSALNVASCRVARRAGFVIEGTKRGEGHHVDGWHDMHLHARLDTDGRRLACHRSMRSDEHVDGVGD